MELYLTCAGVEYGLATLEAGLVPCRRPLIGGALLTCAGVEYGLATLEAGLVPCRRPLIGGALPYLCWGGVWAGHIGGRASSM